MLYVDDESGLLEVGKSFLERTNDFSVTTEVSASAGLNRLKSNGIQAIVSDYQMPKMDGIAFLKQVRATNKTIPFILFTGRGREEIAIEAFENGADFYLQKGGDPKSQFAELGHKIKAAFEHHRADAQVATLNRIYSVLSATNKAIVRIHDKKELLNEICRIVVVDGGFLMAWAGIADPKTRRIEPVASYGYVKGYLDTVSISPEDSTPEEGPTGTAFREKTFNICNDIGKDQTTVLWRNKALERGYHSVAAFPFASDTANAGVITFYASTAGFFNDQIIRLLDEQSGDISFALQTFSHEELRMAAQKDLKESELKYRRLFETAQDAILIIDGNTGEIIDANKFILDMLGYPLEEFIGKHLWELGFLQDKSFAKKAFAELQADGYIRYEDLPLETKLGKAMSVEFISNVYLVDGKRIIQCNIRDISYRKAAQEILQVSESRYRRLFETAQDGILILEGDSGKIIDANKFILDMLGYPLDYFVGRQLWELGFSKDKSFAKRAFEELKTNGYIRYEDLPLETKDGHSIDVEFISNVYLVNHRRIIQCDIRNITERKHSEDALALAGRKLSLLSGITRHDINNQILSLNGIVESLHSEVPDPALEKYFSGINDASGRIAAMIRFTKEYEQVGASPPIWQDCRTLVETAAKEAQPGQIMVKNDLPAGTLIYADPLIVRVFYNLIDNAVRHGRKISTIRFFVEERDSKQYVVCEDDGNGIVTEEKERIFDRGFGKNTGLGLALTREILSITGITIRENGEPGRGARFEMMVPAGRIRFEEVTKPG